MIYMHVHTGSTDDKQGWVESYSADELEERGISAAEAFEADLDVTLFQITPDYCSQNEGRCDTCALVSYGRDCYNNQVHEAWGG